MKRLAIAAAIFAATGVASACGRLGCISARRGKGYDYIIYD